MIWQVTLYSYLYTLAGAVTLATGWNSLRHRGEAGMASLALGLLAAAVWCFANAVEMASVSIDLIFACLTVEYAASSICGALAYLFVLEYYRYHRWLTPRWRLLLWALIGLDVGLVLTNRWHHLVWAGYLPGLPDTYPRIPLRHGPAYALLVGYQSALNILTILILIREAARAAGGARGRALALAAFLLSPLLTSLIFIVWRDQPQGLALVPLIATVSVLLVSWVTFENIRRQVVERTAALERSVASLRAEVARREQLEADLRQSEGALATRLAVQSGKLAGLYDLILISGQPLSGEDLLGRSLAQIGEVLGGAAICFYRADQGALALEARHGLPPQAVAGLARLPDAWLGDSPDVRADRDTAADPALPPAIAGAGYGASMAKWASPQGHALGLLCALWPRPRPFAVEDIVLFGALADALGVILENARLRAAVADGATLQERRRLARDLHDSVTQSLHSLALAAETAGRLQQTRPERLAPALAHLTVSARQALSEMRLLLYDLHPGAPLAGGLAEALQARLDAVERRAGVAAAIEVAAETTWPPDWDRELYQLAMEALNNVLKHAQAARVTIRLRGGRDGFAMEISDDGRGFDARPGPARAGGLGLATMAERAERLGGRLSVRSAPGGGTRVAFLYGGARDEADPSAGG